MNPSDRWTPFGNPEELALDPEARRIDVHDPVQVREKMLDKTDADSFPASDPPSTIPDPQEDSFAA